MASSADFTGSSTKMENTAEKDARDGQLRATLVGNGSSRSSLQTRPTETKEGDNGITILNEATNLKDTAYAFSTKKKWWILTVVALCQTSMSKSLHSHSPWLLWRLLYDGRLLTRLDQTSTRPSTPMPSPRSTRTTTWAPTTSPMRAQGWPGS